MLSKFKVSKMSSEEILRLVKEGGCNLRCIENQTLEICREAVKQHGWALQYVKNQTLEICREAVKQDKCALLVVNVEFLRDDLEELDFGDPLSNLKDEEK